MRKFPLDYVRTCHWDKDLKCDHDMYCEGCPHQPAPDDKPHGKDEPVKIGWEESYDGVYPQCPTCGEMPYDLERCVFCGQRFIQEDERLQEYMKPPEEVRLDCLACGGKGTLVGHRAKSNGHFHGRCEVCGCSVME